MKAKHIFLSAVTALALVLATACSSSDDTETSVGSGQSLLFLASTGLSITKTVDAGTGTIYLPAAIVGYSGVSIAWTSSDTSIIDPETGLVTHGTADEDITLTALLTDSNLKTLTKTFTVTVAADADGYTDNALIAATAALPTTASALSALYPIGSYTLPSSVTLSNNLTYNVAWAQADDSNTHVTIDSSSLTVTRDIYEVAESLTVTVTYTGNSSETATKTVAFTLPAVTNIIYTDSDTTATYTFDNGTLTVQSLQDDELFYGITYFYVLSDSQTLTASLTSFYSSSLGDEWLTETGVASAITSLYEEQLSALKAAVTTPTYDTLYTLFTYLADEDEGETAESLLEDAGITESSTTDDFTATLTTLKTTLIADFSLAEDADWSDIYSAIEAEAAEVAEQSTAIFFTDRVFSYELLNIGDDTGFENGLYFTSQALYDATYDWYQQLGCYEQSSGSVAIKFDGSNSYFRDSSGAEHTIRTCTESTFGYTDDSGETVTWAVTADSSTGALTITNSGTSYTLSFEGNNL